MGQYLHQKQVFLNLKCSNNCKCFGWYTYHSFKLNFEKGKLDLTLSSLFKLNSDKKSKLDLILCLVYLSSILVRKSKIDISYSLVYLSSILVKIEDRFNLLSSLLKLNFD